MHLRISIFRGLLYSSLVKRGTGFWWGKESREENKTEGTVLLDLVIKDLHIPWAASYLVS